MRPRWLVLLILAVTALRGQNISCALSGAVEDSLGAPFSAIEVHIAGAQNGFVRTSRTNANGFFAFPDLTPGAYTLSISAPGFAPYRQSGIELNSGEHRSLGSIRLRIGQLSDSVTVTADTSAVQLGSSDRAGVLTATQLESMALRGRDFLDAVGLLPGVVDTSDNREAPSNSSIGNLYILGGRSNQKNMTIDGVTNLDTGSNGSVHSMPSLDSVAEVKVLMSNYAAEYGRNSGGAITVITKGGGQQFHGSAGWYYRHEDLSANGFFDNKYGLSRAPYRYDIAAYTISGPIYVPRHFNADRSKLFFFFSEEFQEQKVPFGVKTVHVPTALERSGDFSQSFDVNNKLIPVYDPQNNGKQFPQNRIPVNRINVVGGHVLDLFPLPNFVDPEPSRRNQWNYISALSGPYPRRTEIVRTDYSPKQNVQLYARLSNTVDEQHPPYGPWVTGSVNFPLTPIVFRSPGRGGTLHNSISVSPTVFNELIFGVSQNKLTYFPEFPDRVTRAGTGIAVPQWYPGLNTQDFIPNMSFGGVSNAANPSLSNGTPYYNSNTIFTFVENLSKVYKTHTFKAGAYIERTRKDQSASVATRGTIAFDRDRNSPLDTNYAYSNALLGIYDSYSEASARPQGQFRFSNLEWYVQDAWRATPRLNVDYGVRFYHDAPQYDARDQLATFIPALFDPSRAPVLYRPALDASKNKVAVDPTTGQMVPAALTGTYVPGVGDPTDGIVIGGKRGYPHGLYSAPALSIAPRFGFAWDPIGRGRTAVRGGIGTFFDRIQGNPTMDTLSNPPTIFTPTIYYGTLSGLAATSNSGLLAPSNSISALLGNQALPAVYNYSLGVQQQIGRSLLVDVSYVGAISRHFLWKRNINPVPFRADHLDVNPQNADPTGPTRPLPKNFLRPYPGFGDIDLYEFASTSNYNSLQVSVAQRSRHGLTYGLAYTFSKLLGSAASDTTTISSFFSPRDRDYGPLDYDRTHVFSVWYTWELPKPGQMLRSRPLRAVADGWQISGTTRASSGAPFTPGFSTVDGQDITGTPTEGARIQVVNPAADPLHRFGRPARATWGNAGFGILRKPGIDNWDVSLYREFKIRERQQLQLRLETYNTLNHTQFSDIQTSARFDLQGNQVDPLFLRPTAARSPRRVQLAARFNW